MAPNGSIQPLSRTALAPLILRILVFVLVCAATSSKAASSSHAQEDSFREHLSLRPLQDGRVHALFSFDLQSPIETSRGSDKGGRSGAATLPIYSYVPRSLIHLARGSQAEELHLAINAGRWNYEKWGAPAVEHMVGTGAEVRANLKSDESRPAGNVIPSKALANWRKLTADLAGLFCASLDALDERLTVLPFEEGHTPTNGTLSLRAMLSSESICTENLSTLLKLLPCKTMAGLASLLEPHHFFRSDFHGMVLHLSRREGGWQVKINVQAVFSPALQPNARPKRDWSLDRIFGVKLYQSCPLAQSSAITVLAPPRIEDRTAAEDAEADFNVWPIVMLPSDTADIDSDETLSETDKLIQKAKRFALALRSRGFYTFDTRASTELNVEMKWPHEGPFSYPNAYQNQPLTASRVLSGYGQERGTVELTVRNNERVRERNVVYEEVLPWFMKPYLHTLRADVLADDFDEGQDDVVRFVDDITSPAVRRLNYTPSTPRAKPFHLQVHLRVPPQSQVRLVYEYEKAFLRYAEHPPDAHRGFDVAPAIVQLEDGTQLYTEPALVEVAVPDFSMPYNVIIFTSTVIALCAGSILNNLIRRYTDVVLTQAVVTK